MVRTLRALHHWWRIKILQSLGVWPKEKERRWEARQMSENSLLPPVSPSLLASQTLKRPRGGQLALTSEVLAQRPLNLVPVVAVSGPFFFHKILLPAGEIRSRSPMMATPSFLICLRKSPSWPLLRAKVRQLNWCKGPGLAPMALP